MLKGSTGTPMSYVRNRPCDRADGKIEMRSRFESKCAGCGKKIFKGHVIFYLPEARSAWHTGCEDMPRKGRVGYSSKATRAVGLNGGGGSSNKKVR